MRERTEGQPEKPLLKVKLGEPFGVKSGLKFNEEHDSLWSEYPIYIAHFQIENICNGAIRFLRDVYIINERIPFSSSIKTPAGPIRVLGKYIIDNSEPKLSEPKLIEGIFPLGVHINIGYLTKERLETIGCKFAFGNEDFEGIPAHDDQKLEQDLYTNLYFDNLWIDPKTQEKCELLFPSNKPEVFEKMQFVIKERG